MNTRVNRPYMDQVVVGRVSGETLQHGASDAPNVEFRVQLDLGFLLFRGPPVLGLEAERVQVVLVALHQFVELVLSLKTKVRMLDEVLRAL